MKISSHSSSRKTKIIRITILSFFYFFFVIHQLSAYADCEGEKFKFIVVNSLHSAKITCENWKDKNKEKEKEKETISPKYSSRLLDFICSLEEKCLNTIQIQNILKNLTSSKIINNFKIEDKVVSIFPNIMIKKVNITHDKTMEKLKELQEIKTKIKNEFEGKFISDIKTEEKICEQILKEEGLIDQKCSIELKSIRFEESELNIKISGRFQKINEIKINGVSQEEKEELLRRLEKNFKGKVMKDSNINSIEKEVKEFMYERGFYKCEVKLEKKDSSIEISIKPNKRHTVFLNIEREKELGINSRKILSQIPKLQFISERSIKNLIAESLRKDEIPVDSVEYKEIDLEDITILSIDVKLAKLYYLTDFKIYGLEKLDEDEIKRKIGVKTKGIINIFYIRYALYTERQIDNFIYEIIGYAKSKGFDQFRIEKVQKTKIQDEIKVEVYAKEGERTVISKIQVLNFPENVESIIPKTPMFYDFEKISDLKDNLQKYLEDKGYRNFKIEVIEERETKILKNIYLVYVGDEQKSELGQIFIYTETSPEYIKKIADIKEGKTISSKYLEKIENEIIRTQYFKHFQINLSELGESEIRNEKQNTKSEFMKENNNNKNEILQSSPTKKYMLTIQGYEGDLNEIEVSGGLSTVEGVRGRIQYTRKNILFSGIDFRTNFRAAYWIFPFGRDFGITFLGASAEITRRKLIGGFDSSLLFSPFYTSTFLFTIQKPVFSSATLSQSHEKIKISIPVSFELRELLAWDTNAFKIRPENAGLKEIFVIFPSISFNQNFSKDHQFKIGIKSEIIKPISKNFSSKLEIGGEYYNIGRFGGFGLAASIGRIMLYENLYDVPIERRFFIGGMNGPRGYQEISIFPQKLYSKEYLEANPEKLKTAENKIVLLSEIYAPKIFFATPYFFFDVGNVFHDGDKLEFFKGTGPGIMLDTPFGIFRFELGYGIERKTFIIHFSVGFMRNII
jgi:outer membrane protein assembly factor BamA